MFKEMNAVDKANKVMLKGTDKKACTKTNTVQQKARITGRNI